MGPIFAPDYQKLQSRGLSKTAALVVIARKLARIAWGIFRSGKEFDPRILNARACATT
jgi:transposase